MKTGKFLTRIVLMLGLFITWTAVTAGAQEPTAESFVGIVRGNDGSTLQVEGYDDATQSTFMFNVTTSEQTEVFADRSETSIIPLGNIPEGNVVSGEGEKQSNGDFIAYKIYDEGPADEPGDGGDDPGGNEGPQPGDSWQFGGQVSNVTASSFDVTWENPDDGTSGTDTYYYSSSTQIVDQYGNPATLSNGVFVDGQVVVQNDGSLLATSIIVYPEGGGGPLPGETWQFGGDVTAVTSTTFDVTWEDPMEGTSGTDTYAYDSNTVIVDESGNPTTLAVGDFVEGTAVVQGDGSFLATHVTKFEYHEGPQPGEILKAGGEVISVSGDVVITRWEDPESGDSGTDTLTVPAGTPVVDQNGDPATIEPGVFIDADVEVQDDGSFEAFSVTVYTDAGGPGEPGDSIPFEGTVAAVGNDYLDVTVDKDGQVMTVRLYVDQDTRLLDESASPIPLSSFTAGEYITGILDAEDPNRLLADVIKKGEGAPSGEVVEFEGQVTEVGADYLQMTVEDPATGATISVRLTIDQSTILLDVDGTTEITVNDFAVGDQVFGSGVPGEAEMELVAGYVQKGSGGPSPGGKMVGGVLQEVGADYVVIEAVDPETNETSTVSVLVDNQTTILDEDSTAITLADLAPGDQVFAMLTETTGGDLLALTLSRMKSGTQAEISFAGNIIRIYGDEVFVRGISPTGVTFFLRVIIGPETTLLDESGNAISSSRLAVGGLVHGEGDLTGSFAVDASLLALGDGDSFQIGQKIPFSGIVAEVGTNYFVSEYGHPALTKTNYTDSQTVIRTASGSDTSLQAGDFFKAVSVVNTDGSLTVLEVRTYDGSSQPPGVDISMEGTITEVGGDYLIISDQTEGELKVLVLPNTQDANGNPVSAGNFSPGGQLSGDGAIQACELVVLTGTEGGTQPQNVPIGGMVSGIGPDYLDLTFTATSGADSTLRVIVDAGTVIVDEAGNPLDLGQLGTGDQVEGEAQVATDGSITLVSITVTPATGTVVSFTGQIDELGTDYFAVSGALDDGTPVSGNLVYSDTTIFTDYQGNSTGVTSFAQGDSVSGRVLVNPDSSLYLLSVMLLTPTATETPFAGAVLSTDHAAGTITVQVRTGGGAEDTLTFSVGAQAELLDADGNTITIADLIPLDVVQGDYLSDGSGTRELVRLRVTDPQPRPGEPVDFNCRIESIGESMLTVTVRTDDGSQLSATVNIGPQTSIQTAAGLELTLQELAAGDTVHVEGLMSQTSATAVDASVITYVSGSLKSYAGKVVQLTNDGFELETRSSTGATIVVGVAVSSGTRIERIGTGETLTSADILRGMTVGVRGRLAAQGSLEASLVRLPQPNRERFEGRVASVGTQDFLVAVRETDSDVVVKVKVTVNGDTRWLAEVDGTLEPSSFTELAADDFVRVAGILTGTLTVQADTVIIESTEEFELRTYTVLNGSVSGSVFSFDIDQNEGDAGAAQSLVAISLGISADYRNLEGDITLPGEPPMSLNLTKITGEEGILTGRWNGPLVDEDTVGVSAELYQSGSSVTGALTLGGTIDTGGDSTEVGGAVKLPGKVVDLEGETTLIVSYLDRLNQEIERPVVTHSGTVILDTEGNELDIPLDSLLQQKVVVEGILQNDFSVVANTITVRFESAEGQPSADLPVISAGSWNRADNTLSLTVDQGDFDEALSGDLTLAGTVSGDRQSLSLSGTFSTGESLTVGMRRMEGEEDSPEGFWAGTARTMIDSREKIWPMFLDLIADNSSLRGNYEVGEGRIRAEITVQNLPPSIEPVAPVAATEGQQASVTISASDPEGGALSLAPGGAAADYTGAAVADNGDGTWTLSLTIPTMPEGRDELFIEVLASDTDGASNSIVVVFEVTRLNRPPELPEFSQVPVFVEGKTYTVPIPADDPEGEELEYEFEGLPAWVTVSHNVLTIAPTAGSAGDYQFTVTVEDEQEAEVSATISFKVIAANRAPRFAKIDPVTAETGQPVSFTVQATDPDAGDVLTYSVLEVNSAQVIPAGATFDAVSGAFSWTPSAEQVGPFKAAFKVTDSKGASDRLLVNILVGPGHEPPSVTVNETYTVNQGEQLQFNVTGQSSEEGVTLSYYARDLPRGAGFDNETATFSWTPDYRQAGEYPVVLGVGDGSFRTEVTTVITVNPVALVPELDELDDMSVSEGKSLRFRVSGNYQDGSPVVFDPPAAGALPPNSTFNTLTGVFRFRPDYTQAGQYALTFNVTDPGGTVHSVSNTVTVDNTNRPPRLGKIDNVAANTGDNVSFTVTADDPDAGDQVSLSQVELPAGASFDAASGAFSWTPAAEGTFEATFKATDQGQASDQRTVYITVGTQNLPPSLGQIADLNISEGDTLVLGITVSDPENDPVSVFVNPLPANATYDDQTATFTFQPSYAQAGRYNLRFTASDGELITEQSVAIQVADVPLAPTIRVPLQWTVGEGDTLRFTAQVRDAAGLSTAVVGSGLPEGAMLDSETGEFFWSPDYEQAGSYLVSLVASDGPQSTRKEVTIQVTDTNRPPEIFELADQEVDEGDVLSFEISFSDPDGDAVAISLDSTRTPYISSADIRNNSVFVFNTALLDTTLQIPSAVFTINADDGRGGSASETVEFKIVRSADVDVPGIDPGGEGFSHGFPGTGLGLNMQNTGSSAVPGGSIQGFEISGTLEGGNTGGAALLAAASDGTSNRYGYLSKSKDRVRVRPFLSDDGSSGGDFYGIRRGWGLDLSTDLTGSLQSLTFDLTLTYEERDIPAMDIPEFTEAAISVFGLNQQGQFVQIATQLDTALNTASAQVDLAQYTDVTLGVILDLAEPVIAGTDRLVNTTDEQGPYTVSTVIVDNVLVSSAKLYYSTDGQNFTPVDMTPDTTRLNSFSAAIPGQREGSTVYYYVEASDEEHTVADPQAAPQSFYSFKVLIDGMQQGGGNGDVDGNGTRDIFDLLELLKVLSGKQQANSASDVDSNGKVDIFDLLEVLKLLAN